MEGTGRVLKVVAVGDGSVGKTSLLVAYTQGAFNEQYIPTVFENYAGDIEVDGKKYNFTLWDTAGQETYDRCRVLCYQGANVFLVCFSVNCLNSFENVKRTWIPEVRKENGEGVAVVLVGTKTDLRVSEKSEGFIRKADGRKLAKSLNLSAYVECSAKEMVGLEDVFTEAVRATEPAPRSRFSCVLL